MPRRKSFLDNSQFRDIQGGQISENSLPFSLKEEEVFLEKGGGGYSVEYESADVILLKGSEGEADIRIDLANTRTMIQELRKKHARTLIRELRGVAEEKFRSIVELTQVLYETPAYHYLYEIITSEFCMKENAFPAGTVGAYFCGCYQKNNFRDNPACSVTCAEALQPEPGCRGWHSCDCLILLYEGKNSFRVLNSSSHPEKAYLFIRDSIVFSGLSSGEMNYLKQKGIQEVKIVLHSEGLSYQEISSDFLSLEALHISRFSGKKSGPSKTFSGKRWGLGLLLLLLLLLILLGGGYLYMHSRHGPM